MTNSIQKIAPSSLKELKEAFAKLSTERIRLEAEHFRIASLIQDAEFNARLGVTQNMAKKRRVIAVDLDGTLAKTRSDGLIGDPVKPMVDRVKRWHSKGIEVRIFTSRLDSWDGLSSIRYWLRVNGLPDLQITNKKTGDIEEFWDNRAIRVEDSTGKMCDCCDKSRDKNSPSRDFTTDC